MIGLTICELCAACGGEWQGAEDLLDKTPSDIVTDSRQASKGSLFLALRGEKTDGHRYIPDVLQQGALAVLAEEGGAPGEPRILVPNVMDAMRKAARMNRSRFSIPFIGVTGSVGKTTAKEMLASALSGRLRTFKTPGSMNGQIGIPVALTGMEDRYDAAVIEMGISLHGEMRRLTEIVHPDMAVFTNIGDAHLEAFHDRPGILKEKSELLLGMPSEGVIFYNGDDELLRAANFGGRRKVCFGLGEKCDVRAENVRYEDGTTLCCTVIAPGRRFPIRVDAYGSYMIYSVLSAAAVAIELGLSDAEIAEGMSHYETIGHRSRVLNLGWCTLVDDCYNANPTSNRAAIDSIMTLGEGRKVCILGDMRELGENSRELHRALGEYAVSHGVESILTQGDEAACIAEAAGETAVHFSDKASLIASLSEYLKKGDIVLVKASHGPGFDEVVRAIEKL